MNRRVFLTWLGLGLLASASPIAIAALINQDKPQQTSDFVLNGLEPVLFYVAPNGNDGWSGKWEKPNWTKTDGPFATLHRARDAIRELKNQQGGILKQSVIVFLRGGTYFLSEPLIFTPEDSGTADFPITYRAYRKEKPVISGGQRITGWKQQGNLWVANLPEVKTGKWYFRLLRVGDDWAIRARYPNFDSNNPLTGGWLYVNRPEPVPMEQGNFNSGVSRIHNRGDKIEWNIFVPATGKYKVWLRYGHNMKDYGTELMDDRTAIRIGNSTPVPLRNLPDTGSWTNYRWTLAAKIDLSAGEKTLVWQNIKGGGINLDAFCLTDDPDWNPVTAISILKGGSEAQIQQPKQGKHLIIVHAETFEKAVGRDLAVFPKKPLRDRIPIAPPKFPNWQNWEGAEVHIFPAWGWVNAILPVKNVDKQSSTLYVNSTQDIRPGNRFFIANVREALDTPGEWCLDKNTGELVYWPREPSFPNNVEVVAPAMDRLIVLEGNELNDEFVKQLHFRGLTFRDTDYTLQSNYYLQSSADAAIWLSKAQQCVIEDCHFVKLGGYAIRLDRRSHDNNITRNQIEHLGQGGVILLGNNSDKPFSNSIAANEIHNCGQVYKHVAGLIATSSDGNRIIHNRISRMPRYGISLKSSNSNRYSHNNIVEFNEIVDTCLETNDAGAIETLGKDKQLSGNIIRFNFIRNVVGMGTTADGKIISPYFTKGFHFDDYSSGIKIYGNIVISTLETVVIHGGKDNLVENNIFINGEKSQIRFTPINPKLMANNVIRRNIFVYKNPNAVLFLWTPMKTWQRDRMGECDFNLYWHTGGLDLAKMERAITQEGNFDQWQRSGFDLNSLIADPLFVDPNKENFRLQPDSPAFKLGFQRIPIERIGPQGFN